MKIRANGIDIEVEDSAEGQRSDKPAVLLIMGLGMQLVSWPMAFVQALEHAGFRVIRHDNRDIGLSSQFGHLGKPSIVLTTLKMKFGLPVRPPYQLQDMALDAVGVLDALGVQKAHVVGVSMGGMIAQRVALAAPNRVLSLTSIMSSSGAKGLPEAKPKVIRALFKRPSSASPDAIVAHYLRLFDVIGSPAYPVDVAQTRERILLGYKRSYNPQGVLRQMVAIAADMGKRAQELGRIQTPTLVLHGKADPLVPYACGEDTAQRIPGAKMVGIDGMGHDLPPGVLPLLLAQILPHFATAAKGVGTKV